MDPAEAPLEFLTEDEIRKIRKWRRQMRKIRWILVVSVGTFLLPALVVSDVLLWTIERVSNLRNPRSNALAWGLTGVVLLIFYINLSGGLMIGLVLADASTSPMNHITLEFQFTINFSFWNLISNILLMILHLLFLIFLFLLYIVHTAIHHPLQSFIQYTAIVAIWAALRA